MVGESNVIAKPLEVVKHWGDVIIYINLYICIRRQTVLDEI